MSIFLSAFDVHINRAPYGGRVVEVAERPGKWLAAYKHESAHLNERSDITVERQVGDELRRVHFRQIVGLMARRVVTRVSEGDELTTGQRVGLMKFGSRMDVFVPPECDLLVSTGDRVVAGETVIARWARPVAGDRVSSPAAPGRRRILDRWRLVSPTGARVVSLRQLPKRERARLLAPSAFTTLNMMSGLSSVMLAFDGHYTVAAALIAVSIVLDIADGFVARLIGATSPFGLQLDSLADLISFGLAPAILVHTWALDEWPVLSWLAAFFWLACAAFRLARFNVTIDPLADKRYFVGPALAGRRRRRHGDDPGARLAALRPGDRPVAGVVPAAGQRRPGAAHGDDGALPLVPRPALAAHPQRPAHHRGRRAGHPRRAAAGTRA